MNKLRAARVRAALTICLKTSSNSQMVKSASNSNGTSYYPAYHYFVAFLACATLLLIVAGALVTSNDAGLAVPDWPTSFGSLYKIPPMVGGVRFEHSHRMIAECVGFLTVILAAWTWRIEQRTWMKRLAVGMLLTVIAQGILGGLTVKFFLPWWISTAHATLAQTFFCLVVLMTLFTSRSWIERTLASQELVPDRHAPGIKTLTSLAIASLFVQLILGAAFRHSGIKLLPHLVSAVVVVFLLLWSVTRVFSHFSAVHELQRTALMMLTVLMVQLGLGFSAYLTRVEWGKNAPQPAPVMVATTVAHVVVGAVLLATSVVLATYAHAYVSDPTRLQTYENRGALTIR